MRKISLSLSGDISGPSPIISSEIARVIEVNGQPTVDGNYRAVKALIDTGASNCVVSASLVGGMGLVKIGDKPSMGSEGMLTNTGVYGLALRLPEFDLDLFQMAHVIPQFPDFDMIIGRSVLKHLKFCYNGPESRIDICRPK